MTDKKYEILLGDSRQHNDVTVYRIKALKDFHLVKAGDIGGYIEKESNLSHDGNCWIHNDAIVYGDAVVLEDAKVCDHAIVRGHARVSGNARVRDHVQVVGFGEVGDDAHVSGYALIEGTVIESATIGEYAKVLDSSMANGHCFLYGMAIIRDYSLVTGYATIKDRVIVRGDSVIGEYVTLGGATFIEDGVVKHYKDALTIHPVGGNSVITAFKNTHGEVVVSENNGSQFLGTLTRFERVLEDRGHNDSHMQEYKDAVEYIIKFFHLDD